MAGRRILVIDDDKMIHAVIRASLAKHGYEVHSAFDSVQAAGVARQLKPALIVLDITMPGGGGFEAFRRLQMMSTTSQIPILVYTSLAYEQVAQRIPESETVVHLPKPSSPDVILATVQRLLGDT
jgi:CheY-like chemotaxis protein